MAKNAEQGRQLKERKTELNSKHSKLQWPEIKNSLGKVAQEGDLSVEATTQIVHKFNATSALTGTEQRIPGLKSKNSNH